MLSTKTKIKNLMPTQATKKEELMPTQINNTYSRYKLGGNAYSGDSQRELMLTRATIMPTKATIREINAHPGHNKGNNTYSAQNTGH